ncbi:putative MFS family arabinose efflux permease [Catenulispora sp. EB89]|uniref:MFS transporter n=1 Tax=Catenulispora sp. EB89 TaxID=3156257 RepID=UPI003515EAF3
MNGSQETNVGTAAEGDPEIAEKRASMLGTLRNRDYRLILTGQLLSSIGTWLLLVAAPFFVFRLTGSTMATGLSMAAETVPAVLLGPVAGVFVDRWDRRWTMIATDVLRAGAVLLLLLVQTRGEVWIVYAALALESAFGQCFGPAQSALIPNLVGRGPELSAANSLGQLVGGTIRLVGGPLGGVLFAVAGFRAVVTIDAASYLASAYLIAMIRFRASRGARDAGAQASDKTGGAARLLSEDLRHGLGHLGRTPGIPMLFGVAAIFFTGNAILTALLVPYLGTVLNSGAQSLGVLFGTLGVGFIIGAPASRLVAGRLSDRTTIVASLGALAAVFALTFNTPYLAGDIVLFALIGPPATCFLVTADTAITRRTPDRLQGRVSSTYLALQSLATLVGMVAGSLLGQQIGIVTTMDAAAVLVAVSAGAALWLPGA